MSNQGFGESVADFQPTSARQAGRWYSVVGTFGMVLLGVFLVWSFGGPAENAAASPQSYSRTVIRWRRTPIFSLAWSPDGQRLAASCFGPEVRVWDQKSGIVSTYQGGTEQPRFALGWSPDGQQLMVSGLDLPIESWDLFHEITEDAPIVSRPLDLTRSTETLIQTTGARPIRLWGPSDKRFGPAQPARKSANSIAFSGDGRFLASGGVDGLLEIRNPATGAQIRTIDVDPRGITAVTFSPDGSKLATSGPGPTRIFEVTSGREVTRLGDGKSGSATLGFSPDGSKLAVATWDGSILIWDLATSTTTQTLRGHHGQILSMAWSPDGKSLASGGYDSNVRVWDLDDSDSKPGPG